MYTILFISLLLVALIKCSSISLLTAPDGCRAGLPCLQQPIVKCNEVFYSI